MKKNVQKLRSNFKRPCCDMRGFLSFQILWLLSKANLTGEQLAGEIEKRRGERPKAGTIYPALKELKKNGMVTGRKDGKTVIYSLTPDGKAAVKQAREYFCRCFRDILKD